MMQTGSLPTFSNDDLGHFAGRLRDRLFSSQAATARHFGLKSHSTISRYESNVLKPPVGYMAHLVQLFVEKLDEGQMVEAAQDHFLQEMNRAVRRHYYWDEETFQSWAELCMVADRYLADIRQLHEIKSEDSTNDKLNPMATLPPNQIPEIGLDLRAFMARVDDQINPTLSILSDLLAKSFGVETIALLFGDKHRQRDLRNRQKMLNLVKEIWIKGLLEKSLHQEWLIELGMQEKRDAIEQPWGIILQTTDQPERLMPPGTKMLDLFHEAEQSLLILGEPGAGKTTMLLELARDLIGLAEQTLTRPIPVVFNLSSWADSSQSLADWLVSELKLKYMIPKRIAQGWIADDALCPLLDGLDEMAPAHRGACVQAINEFREEYLMPLVVCSRLADYEALSVQLRVRSAVLLQPLTDGQIDTYLQQRTTHFSVIQQMLQADANLRLLARSPLMLSIMVLAYAEGDIEQTDQSEDTLEADRQHLFETYVKQMFQRKLQERKPYDDHQTKQWLAWLAKNLRAHSQTVYLLEQTQPSWLSSRTWQSAYLLGSRLFGMLYGGVLIGLAIRVIGANLFHYPAEAWLIRPGGWLLFGLILGLSNGLIFSLIDQVRVARSHRPDQGNQALSLWQTGRNMVVIGLIFGWVDGLILSWFTNTITGWLGGLILGILYGVSLEIRGRGRSLTNDIQPIEALGWFWGRAMKGLAFGLIGGLAGGLISGWIIGLDEILMHTLTAGTFISQQSKPVFMVISGLNGAVVLGSIGALLGGISSNIIDSKMIPNQGMRLSLRNGLFLGIGFGLISGTISGILFGIFRGGQMGIVVGSAASLCFGGFAILWYGGQAIIEHYTLRFLLTYNRHTPLNYTRFLDYAVDCIFLRKVGGGYVFVHRLLLDYFASLDSSEPG